MKAEIICTFCLFFTSPVVCEVMDNFKIQDDTILPTNPTKVTLKPCLLRDKE